MVDLAPAADDPGQPTPELIEELLGRGWLVHLRGVHGSGKSLTATSIAYHQAA